jgi:hypothetical protein
MDLVIIKYFYKIIKNNIINLNIKKNLDFYLIQLHRYSLR